MVAKLELPHPTGVLQAELQRAVDLVAFGLRAADTATPVDLSIPGVSSHVSPAQSRSLSIEEARAEFRSWILANGFRDCVEAIGPSLEWARKFCFIWTRPGDVTIQEDGTITLGAIISGEEWNKEIIEGAKKFDFMGLANKLSHLEQKYGFRPPSLHEHILTLNKARNCLSHRRGIVGEEDVNDPSGPFLRIVWRRLQFTVRTEQGEKPLELPAHVEAGSLLAMSFVDTSKRFAIGERLQITPEEFVEMAMTFLLFALQLQESLKQMEERRRIEASSI